MAETLTLPNGTPYNVVIENGRVIFANALFGNVGSGMPSELRIVPQNLIPGTFTTYKGKKYAYIPESIIVQYFSSDQFKKSTYATSGPGATPYFKADTITAVQNAVKKNTQNYDQTSRSQQWQSAPNKKPFSTSGNLTVQNTTNDLGQKTTIPTSTPANVGPQRRGEMGSDFVPGSSNWGSLLAAGTSLGAQANTDGSLTIFRGQEPMLVIGRSDGTAELRSSVDYVATVLNEDPKVIKQYQKALKQLGYLDSNYKITGQNDPLNKFGQAVMQLGQLMSQQNYLNFLKDKSAKALTSLDVAKQYAKSGTAVGPYATQTSVSTNKSIATFTKGETQSILESFYTQTLGRRPSKQELETFTKVIEAQAKKNPNVTTTTSTGNQFKSTSSTKTSQGYSQADAQIAARKQAEADPMAHQFLVNTQYFDAVLNAINNPKRSF